ncbi:MAG TPA: hypothetical protein VMJ75_21195 [Candidatus Acidoferrales bacterium]|nr:hypothetical protein [Candidatus Acidoferrales bacterium]
MKRVILLLAPAAVLGLLAYLLAQTPIQRSAGAAPAPRTAIRIQFGERQDRETDYSGSLALSEGRVMELIPWRFFGNDQIQGNSAWRLTTRRANMENQPDQPRPISTAGQNQNIVPKAVSAVIDAPGTASVTVQTGRGSFQFRLSDLSGGRTLEFEAGDVTVQAVPAPGRISPAVGPSSPPDHDYPAIAIAADGSAWAAWQVYENGGDRVLAARSTADGWSAPEPLTAAGQDVFHTAIAEDGRGRVWVVWSQRDGETWDLIARFHDGRNWTAARKITSANPPNFFHKLVRDRAGNLHLVWIGHQNAQSHVFWSKLAGDSWSAAQEISGASAWMPDAAADSKGNLYVAWDSYRTGNYDIFLRRIGADGTMDPLQQVTKSSRFQAHASVAVDANDRLWLAWDESGSNWGKDYSRDDTWRGTTLYADRHPRVAVLENGKWSEPADPRGAMPKRYDRYAEGPQLACDGAGRIWMALRVRTMTAMNRTDFWANNGRWDMFLTAYEGDHWRTAAQLPSSSTRPDGPFQLAPAASGVWAVWTNDNRLFPAAAGQPNRRRNEIDFARTEGGPPAPAAVLAAFGEPPANAAFIHPREAADIQRARSYRAQTGGAELRIVRGDFHRHTEISPDGAGDGSLEDYFRYMLDAAGMDTGIVSDHNAGLDEYTWWRTEKAIDLYHIPGGYTPLFGYERSVPYPNGHRNVVFAQRGVHVLPISQQENQNTVNTGPILYPYLKQNRGICMLHSLATDQGSDYRDNDPEVEPLVEIYQGYHANYEYEGAPRAESADYNVATHGPYRPAGFYWNALKKGYKLGTESSSDHISTHSSYTMIYTPSTARRDIVESMRKRHAYGATDNIVLDVRARDRQGGEWMMGDILEMPAQPTLHVKVLGTSVVQSVEVVKDGKFVYKTEPNADTAEFDFTDTASAAGQSWYYVRVIQADRNMAWSSPIWITRK